MCAPTWLEPDHRAPTGARRRRIRGQYLVGRACDAQHTGDSTYNVGDHGARRPLEVTALLDTSGPFFESWTHAFPNGTDEDFARARMVDPDAFNDDGLWHLDFHCFAIRRPDGHITLVDTGVGPADSPASAWAPVPGVLPDALTTAGIGVDEVDFVVLSHLHEDHIGWVVRDGRPLFAEATYLVQQAELHQLEQGPDRTIWNYAIAPLLDSGQLDAISGHTRLRVAHGVQETR
jgi:glyoxylase-like metal-dependent hydrolase (beta-lactamase superfamily II)